MHHITSYEPDGFEGTVVRVEVDIRRGIPGMDIVGLPDGAVREARERVRVAIRNSGFRFPSDRILVNLAPADVRKGGAGFDLPIATAILVAAGAVPALEDERKEAGLMVMGELDLSGEVRPVRGVLPAVACGASQGITHFVVPSRNRSEAAALGRGTVIGVSSVRDAVRQLDRFGRTGHFSDRGEVSPAAPTPPRYDPLPDFIDMAGAEALKRAVTVAVAGRHHLLLYGPPGSGKSMAAQRTASILPELDRETAVSVSKIHSIAGLLDENEGLLRRAPFRAPHHSASMEGLVGGGRPMLPGEASLAHGGVLFLDEASEFRPSILQALREPIETKRVLISRAGGRGWFPSNFQLLLAGNSCPCGNLGRDEEACLCSRREVQLYWRRLGGPLMDRVDIRVRTTPPATNELLYGSRVTSAELASRVVAAREIQRDRLQNVGLRVNADIPVGSIRRLCPMHDRAVLALEHAARHLTLSARAHTSVVRIARTIADLEGHDEISASDVEEAIELRKYGEGDLYWR